MSQVTAIVVVSSGWKWTRNKNLTCLPRSEPYDAIGSGASRLLNRLRCIIEFEVG
jgi:hypothetical protein